MIERTATELPNEIVRSFESVVSSRRYQEPQGASQHSVQFYLDDDHLTASAGRFICTALAAGDAAIVVATADHTAAIELFLSRTLDLEQLRRSGRYVALNARNVLAKIQRDGQLRADLFQAAIGDPIDQVLATAESGRSCVAVYGEVVALLSEAGNHTGALALEQMWNELIERRPISLHCGYPLRAFNRNEDADIVHSVCTAHSAVIPAENFPLNGNGAEQHTATVILQQRAQRLEQEMAKRQRALDEREAELTAALATRDEFLLAAAHELKTPVTSLRVYAQLLQRDLARKQAIDPKRLASALQAIERQTGRLSHLVGQLIDVTQLDSRAMSLDRETSDLVYLTRDTVDAEFSTGSHEIVLRGLKRAQASLDTRRIRQVLTILLSNAVTLSPPGSRIDLRIERKDREIVQLSVTDQGPVIDDDERELIFERFHQPRGHRYTDGIGLSLYLAHQIVLLHGGTLTVDSSEQPGARFVVSLPAPS